MDRALYDTVFAVLSGSEFVLTDAHGEQALRLAPESELTWHEVYIFPGEPTILRFSDVSETDRLAVGYLLASADSTLRFTIHVAPDPVTL